jgi:hypothetical protein
MGTHKYITAALLFFFSFTLLPLFLAGWLAQVLPVWRNSHFLFYFNIFGTVAPNTK